MTKLALILDKAPAYVAFQRDLVLDSWGIQPSEVRPAASLEMVGSSSLFGSPSSARFELENVDEVKQAAAFLATLDREEAERKFAAGLVISSPVPRVSTKKLEAAVKALGGEVFVSNGKAYDTLPGKIISMINLTPEVRDFALAYVGRDYEALIPLVTAISKLPREAHRRVTQEDIYLRLAGGKGVVAPYAIEKPLLDGSLTDVIDIFRRVDEHESFLVILAVLRNKFQLAYRVAVLLESDPKLTEAKIAPVLQVPNNYPLKLAKQSAQRYGLVRLTRIVKVLADAEKNVKGGSAAPSSAVMELALVNIYTTLRKR